MSTMAERQENKGEFGKERSVEADHSKDKSEFYTPPIDVSLLGKKFEINSVLALDTLKEVEYNWSAFVATLRSRFYAHGYTDEVLNQFLIDFSSQLPHLGLNEEELRFIELSRVIYLDELQRREVEGKSIYEVSDDGESNEDDYCKEESEETIKKESRRISDK